MGQTNSLTELEEDLSALKTSAEKMGDDVAGIGDELVSVSTELCLMKRSETIGYCAKAALYLAQAPEAGTTMDHAQKLARIDLLLKTGCSVDDGLSCMLYLHPDIRSEYSSPVLVANFEKGVKSLGPMCQQGIGPQCANFADGLWWFSQGGSLPEQLQKAMPAALKRSCDLGDIRGCLAFADALADGTHGFPQSIEAAKNLRTQMCNKNIEDACSS